MANKQKLSTTINKSIITKLRDQNKLNDSLLVLVSNLTLEDLIAIKLELSCDLINNRLYEEDAKNRRCSRSGCPLPSRCFHLREEKQLNHKIKGNMKFETSRNFKIRNVKEIQNSKFKGKLKFEI